jgi:flavin reductase (DIM6/NTAB) family NADH-FMN oxidoreductase RutF
MMKKIDPKELTPNVIELIGHQWMLVTPGRINHFNTMTASWGGVGFLWNKPVVHVYVRPERYTFEFMEAYDTFTLSFLAPGHRKALNICGSQSGRDTDKVTDAGLHPATTEAGNVYFEEAGIVLECRTLYADFLKSDHFLEPGTYEKWYGPQIGGLHKMYVAEIVNAYENYEL